MARYHGKRGRVYMGATTGGAAVAVASLNSWTLEMGADEADVTSFGDANKRYVQGLPDARGALSGFWDDAEDTIFDAAGTAGGVNMYLYPSLDAVSEYWYGVAWVDISVNVPVGDAATVACTWRANSDWTYIST